MQRQQYCRAAGSMWHGMWWCDPERAQARHVEPWSQRARLGAWRLRWIACGRARHSLSSVGVVVVLVHFVCRNAHLSSCHATYRSSGLWALGESRAASGRSASLTVTPATCGLPGRSLSTRTRVQSGGAAARIPLPRPSGTLRIARSQGHPALGADICNRASPVECVFGVAKVPVERPVAQLKQFLHRRALWMDVPNFCSRHSHPPGRNGRNGFQS